MIPRAPMHRDRRSPAVLARLCDLDRVDLVFGIPLANLDRHRHVDCRRHRFHDPPAQFRLAHQRTAAMIPRDLRCGTPHVDIQPIGLLRHRHACRRGQRIGIVAKELDRRGTLPLIQHHQFSAFPIAVGQRLCAHHFRHRKRRTVFSANASKRRIGHARHRRERRAPRDLYRTNSHTYSSSSGRYSKISPG